MPREMKIEKGKGPGFKQIAYTNSIFAEDPMDVVFKLDQEIPEGMVSISGPNALQSRIKSITKNSDDPDEFTMVLTKTASRCHLSGEQMVLTSETYYYVIHYNCRTREGTANEYTKDEFFSGRAMRDLIQF